MKIKVILLFGTICLISCNQNRKNFTKNKNQYSIIFDETTFLNRRFYGFNVETKDTTNLTVKGEYLDVWKDKVTGNYVMSGNQTGNLIIYKRNDTTENEVYRKRIKFYNTPLTIFLNIGGKSYKNGNVIDINEFLSAKDNITLIAITENYDVSFRSPVFSFSMTVVINDSLIIERTEGDKITKKQFFYISNLKNLHPVIFKDIIVSGSGPNNQELLVPAIFYIILNRIIKIT